MKALVYCQEYLESDAQREGKSVKMAKCWGNVIKAINSSDETGRSIENALKTKDKNGRATNQDTITIVKATRNKGMNEFMEDYWRKAFADATKLTEMKKTVSTDLGYIVLKGEGGVKENTKVTNTFRCNNV